MPPSFSVLIVVVLCLALESVGSDIGMRRWPLGNGTAAANPIASPFGPRIRGSTSAYEIHSGVDLPAPIGSPLYSIDDGTVILNGTAPGFVNTVLMIRHVWSAVNHYSVYLHITDAVVSVGANVSRGDLIGHSGQNGTASYPHVHFEIRAGSSAQAAARNPLRYLPLATNSTDGLHVDAASLRCSSDGSRCAFSASQTAGALTLVAASAARTAVSSCDIAASTEVAGDFETWVAQGVPDVPEHNGTVADPAPFTLGTAVAAYNFSFSFPPYASTYTFRDLQATLTDVFGRTVIVNTAVTLDPSCSPSASASSAAILLSSLLLHV